MKNKYEVWRHYFKLGVFTFQELKEWMLKNIPYPGYMNAIKHARNWHELADIAATSEYCHIDKCVATHTLTGE